MWARIAQAIWWFLCKLLQWAGWATPIITTALSSGYVIATAAALGLSTWAWFHWDSITQAFVGYLDTVSTVVEGVVFACGVPWIDGMIGIFALDTALKVIVLFLGVFIPLAFTVGFGMLASLIGYSLKLLNMKIAVSAAKALKK